MNLDKILNLTAIFVPDKNGGFTAFFAQFPEVIAEGDNKAEAFENLMNLLSVVFEFKQKTEMASVEVATNDNFETQSFKLKLA